MPSYDHATSLGFQLLDARRRRILEGPGIADWAERGKATRFEDGMECSLVEYATSALAATVSSTER